MKNKLSLILGLVAVLFVFALLSDLGYTTGFIVRQERRDSSGLYNVQDTSDSVFHGQAGVNRGGCAEGKCDVRLTNYGKELIGTGVYLRELYECDSVDELDLFIDSVGRVDVSQMGVSCGEPWDDYYAAGREGYCFDSGSVVGGRMINTEGYFFYECDYGVWDLYDSAVGV